MNSRPVSEGRSSSGFPGPRRSAAPEILSYSFRAYVSDGVIDEDELAMIESLALQDGVVDSKERAVLSRILDRIDPTGNPALEQSIRRMREQHGIR